MYKFLIVPTLAALTACSSLTSGPTQEAAKVTAVAPTASPEQSGTTAAAASASHRPGQIDRVVVLYSASGNMESEDVQWAEIRDAAVIAKWIEALEAVPEMPVRGVRMIRFRPNAPRYRVEFYSGDKIRISHRLMGGCLDVAARDGWAFYSGEDRQFTGLVKAVLPGG